MRDRLPQVYPWLGVKFSISRRSALSFYWLKNTLLSSFTHWPMKVPFRIPVNLLMKNVSKNRKFDISSSIASLSAFWVYCLIAIWNITSIVTLFSIAYLFVTCIGALIPFEKSAYSLSNSKKIPQTVRTTACLNIHDPLMMVHLNRGSLNPSSLHGTGKW